MAQKYKTNIEMKDCVCKCKVCDRKFIYGDCQSPMLNDKAWNRVVEFYSLTDYEREANNKYMAHYLRVGRRAKNLEDEHLYICYACMEKALGRKIRRSDLIGKDVPINFDFERMYFE